MQRWRLFPLIHDYYICYQELPISNAMSSATESGLRNTLPTCRQRVGAGAGNHKIDEEDTHADKGGRKE